MSKFQKFTKVSRNLTGPMMLKSFNCSNHIVLAAIETFQHHRTGERCGKLSTTLKIAPVALHILLRFW